MSRDRERMGDSGSQDSTSGAAPRRRRLLVRAATNDGVARSSGHGRGPGRSLRRSVATGLIWSAFGRFGVLGFGILSQAFIARLLRPDEFGSYILVLSVAGTIAMATQAGLPQTTVRTVAGAIARPELVPPRTAVRRVVVMALLTTAIAIAIVLSPLGRTLDAIFPEAGFAAVLGAVAVLVGVRMLENVMPQIFAGLKDFRDASLYGGALAAIVLTAVAAAARLGGGRVSLNTAIWLTSGACIAVLLAGFVQLHLQMRAFPRTPRVKPTVDLRLINLYLWAGTIISFVITQVDLWVVGALGDREQVSLYSAAFRLSILVMIPATIAFFVVPPLVVDLLARNKTKRLENLLQTIAAVSGAPSALVLLVFAAAGGPICAVVYGGFYRDAGPLLSILAIGRLFNVGTGACGVTLIMAGGNRQNFIVMATNLVMTVPLQILGFELWGLAGLASATAFGIAVQNIMLVIAVRRLVGISTVASPAAALRSIRQWRQGGSLLDSIRSALARRGGAGRFEEEPPGGPLP